MAVLLNLARGWRFSRRNFLKSTVAAAASGLEAARGRSDCRKWKVGTTAQLSKTSSVDEFRKLKRAGMEVLELSLGGVDKQLAHQAREWAGEADIELFSGHVPFARDLDPSNPSEQERREVVSRLCDMFDIYALLKFKKLNIHASYEITKPIPAAERQARIESARKSLAALARKAEEIHVQLAVECLPRACLGNTSAEMLTLLQDIPSAGVTLDTNHLFHETPAEFIHKIGARIVNTHVADNDGVDERHWLPGKGVVDFVAIVRALEDVGYPGPFKFECAGTPEEKLAYWRHLKESVSRG